MGRRDRQGRKRRYFDYNRDGDQGHWQTNERNYRVPERKNDMFDIYYKGQRIVPDGEWDSFAETLRKDLPVTFRITGSRGQAKQLLQVIKSRYFSNLVETKTEEGAEDGDDAEAKADARQTPPPPQPLAWYPDEMAWQIDMSRKFIRSSSGMDKLHEFLIDETESGNISRQEAVSMIPPLLMDIKPHHKILDLCAAPGSKTAQLIEYLHCDENHSVPEGYVIANDNDNKRCYLMVHQLKRLQSPNFMIINQDAQVFPKLRITPEDQPAEFEQFDRILADVPCSGDGTVRKNPDVWGKWRPMAGASLHSLQLKILKRGLELLAEGGRLVYSTCSFNPLEDEAVVAEMLRQCKGAIELVDVSHCLPDLKHVPGLSTWRCMNNSGQWYDWFEECKNTIKKSAFPPTPEEAREMHLDRCMRILPHHQNTGGFFICVLTKTKNLPWIKERKTAAESEQSEASEKSDQGETTSSGAQQTEEQRYPVVKKRRVFGYKEDPFFFFKANDPAWPSIKNFYKVLDDFPVGQIMYRSEQGNRKNLYFVSPAMRRIVELNEERVKFINMGLRLMSRNPSPIVPDCDFRLSQECVNSLYKWFPGRYITIKKADAITLLSQENPFLDKLDITTQEQLNLISPGSAIFHFKPTEEEPDPNCEIVFCGWRGKISLRSFVSKHERQHMLLLCGENLKEIRERVEQMKLKKKMLEQMKEEEDQAEGADCVMDSGDEDGKEGGTVKADPGDEEEEEEDEEDEEEQEEDQ